MTVKAAGKKLVVTNGCFDILHYGHVRFLEEARKLGDVLLVGINGDESVAALKGPERPINPLGARMSVVYALKSVTAVVAFNQQTAALFLYATQPDVWVKGGDYTLETLDQDEVQAVKSCGGQIVILPTTAGFSTTSIIERMKCQNPS